MKKKASEMDSWIPVIGQSSSLGRIQNEGAVPKTLLAYMRDPSARVRTLLEKVPWRPIAVRDRIVTLLGILLGPLLLRMGRMRFGWTFGDNPRLNDMYITCGHGYAWKRVRGWLRA